MDIIESEERETVISELGESETATSEMRDS